MDDDALRCSGSGLDLSRGDLQVLSCCGHPAFGGPLVDVQSRGGRQNGQRRLVLAEQVVLASATLEGRQ